MRRAQAPENFEDGGDMFEQLGGDIYADDAEDMEEIRQEAKHIRHNGEEYADRINGRGDRQAIDMEE